MVFSEIFGKKGFNHLTSLTNEKKSDGEAECTLSCKITIPAQLYAEMVAIVQYFSEKGVEVGGLMKMDLVACEGHYEYRVLDYVTLPQEVSSGDFTISEDDVQKFMESKIADDSAHLWRGWWHSHHKMGLFWSSTDDAMFKTMLEGGNSEKQAFGIVFTDDGNFQARLDVRDAWHTVSMDELTGHIDRSEPVNDVIVASSVAAAKEIVVIPEKETYQKQIVYADGVYKDWPNWYVGKDPSYTRYQKCDGCSQWGATRSCSYDKDVWVCEDCYERAEAMEEESWETGYAYNSEMSTRKGMRKTAVQHSTTTGGVAKGRNKPKRTRKGSRRSKNNSGTATRSRGKKRT